MNQVSNYSDVDLVKALRQSRAALEFKILKTLDQTEYTTGLEEDVKQLRRSLEVIEASISFYEERGFV